MKKITTFILSLVLMLCMSSVALAGDMIHVGYYAILKDKYSPTDPLILNHVVRYVGQNPQYYRFFDVYTMHDHELDIYTRHRESISLSIYAIASLNPVEKINGTWQNITTHDLNTGAMVTDVDVKLAGTFAIRPGKLTVYESADLKKKLYENDQAQGNESLNVNTAIIDILNITGPHPGWSGKIDGSTGLPY